MKGWRTSASDSTGNQIVVKYEFAVFQLDSIQQQRESRRLNLQPFFIVCDSRARPTELTLFKSFAEQAKPGTVKPDSFEQSVRFVDE